MQKETKTLDIEFTKRREQWIAEWKDFLRFPSISADPAHTADCVACANWLKQHLARLGFKAQTFKTPEKPVVFAERAGAPNSHVVLFYGHYDVQPPDPLDLWISRPFEPEARRGRIYARGAADNKGQLFYVLKAIESLLRTKRPLPTLKILIEGEEECGSIGIAHFLRANRRRVRADTLFVTDTDMTQSGKPAIVMGLRGIIHLTVHLKGPSHDLHSGVHGGIAPNPATGMAHLLASLHHRDGSIAVSGFMAGVKPPTRRERSLAVAEPVRPKAYFDDTGVLPVGGERGFSPVERAGFRPTIEINGIHSGYGGAGQKTIIPSSALAKITARLVPGQDPQACLRTIVRHLRRNAPGGLTVSFSDCGVSGRGFRLDTDSGIAGRARTLLREVTGHEPVFLWHGASVPIVNELARASGAEPLLTGFGMEADRIHSPNESFSIRQFRMGYLYSALLLSSLATR